MQDFLAIGLHHIDLNGNDGNCVVQELDNVKESSSDCFSHQNCRMLPLRPLPLFVVPVLDCSDYVRLIGLSEHDLNCVHRVVFRIFQEDVQSTTARLPPLAENHLKLAEL